MKLKIMDYVIVLFGALFDVVFVELNECDFCLVSRVCIHAWKSRLPTKWLKALASKHG